MLTKKSVLEMNNFATYKEKYLFNYHGEQEGKTLWDRSEGITSLA
jgi:hypothetical protein